MQYPDIQFDPFFTWFNRPRIMYKPGLRSEIGFEMIQLGGTKVVIYTDKGLVNAGVADMVIEAVKGSDLELVGVFDDIVQDARIDIINRGAAFYREKGADCLIAVGGGSVMDTVKAVNIMIGMEEKDFQPLADRAALWEGAKPLPPHISLPTTAGTGCEITNAVVVLDTAQGVKLALTHPYNADIAMLDPELTVKLPPKITAFTGMDALTHAVEGTTSTGAEPIADSMGLHAIRLIFKYLPIAVREPGNIEARGHMLIASSLAGLCFGNTMCGGVHAMAHALGGKYGVPHGMGNGIMLPIVMEFNIEAAPLRFLMIADAMGINVKGMDPVKAGKKAVKAVKELKKEIGFTETLKDFNISKKKKDLLALVEIAAGDSQISYNPRYLEEADILKLYLKAF